MITQHALPYISDTTPYFEAIRHLGAAVYLDSGRPLSPWGRFDIIAAAPVESLSLGIADCEDPFAELDAFYQRYRISRPSNDDLPFCGGVIGYFSYDLGRSIETLPAAANDFSNLPDLNVGMYLWAVVVDHHKETANLVVDERVSAATVTQVLDLLRCNSDQDNKSASETFALNCRFEPNMSAEAYQQKLTQVDDYIHAGDCYQVNFAQRFAAKYSGDSWQAYKQLRKVAPTPYSAYVDGVQQQILSLSPEQFLELNNNQVTTKPIKGTRPRATDKAEDEALKQELRDSLKDRAENLMIVDLLRNDLSKVCQHNSVKVPKLFNIESYANVHHKVTTVTGKLAPEYSPIELLKHCFPGGSITGAPKIRAMEIIEELEPDRRAIYCGSIGYISFCGKMDTSITIRTLLCEDDNIYCWAGGGIVADSVIEEEYAETFTKVNNLIKTLESKLS